MVLYSPLIPNSTFNRSGRFISEGLTFGMLSYGDLVVWKIHENIEEIRSVDDLGIYKACHISWADIMERKERNGITGFLEYFNWKQKALKNNIFIE